MRRRLVLVSALLVVLVSATAYGLSTTSADAVPEGKYGVNAKNVDAIVARTDANPYTEAVETIIAGKRPKFTGAMYSRWFRLKMMKGNITTGGLHMMSANGPGDGMCEGCRGFNWPYAGSPCASPNEFGHCWYYGNSWICFCQCRWSEAGEPYACHWNLAYPCY